MPVREPWFEDESNDERQSRREAYQRLADAVRRLGQPVERLDQLLRQVASNETETRRFLAEQVYNVPDDLLDDMVRVRLKDLDRADSAGE